MQTSHAIHGVKSLQGEVVDIDGGKIALSIYSADLKGGSQSVHLHLDMGAAGREIAEAIVKAIEDHPSKGALNPA